jgi:hypothetical protein
MQPQRVLIVRALLPSPQSRCIPRRTFRLKSTTSGSSRPQVPFLSGSSSLQHVARQISTERNRRLRISMRNLVRYTVFFVGGSIAIQSILFAVDQERYEREYPTPHDWSYPSRCAYRLALVARDDKRSAQPDWSWVYKCMKYTLERLENEKKDGHGLQQTPEQAVMDCFDISGKSEEWRKGYARLLLAMASAMEQIDGWVLDKKQNYVVPVEMVRGPSNPRPSPLPPGATIHSPNEADCEPYGRPAEYYYDKLLNTPGIRYADLLDAKLARAYWKEFKGDEVGAGELFESAMTDSLALLGIEEPKSLLRFLEEPSRHLSENVLAASTALATHRARHGDSAEALSLFAAILNNRLSLPDDLRAKSTDSSWDWIGKMKGLLHEPEYRLADPRNETAVRNACDEAALRMFIGELLFATSSTRKEEGFNWTMSAIDTAAKELQAQVDEETDPKAGKTCRQCLEASFDNATKMAVEMRRQKQATEAQKSSLSRWTTLWAGWGSYKQPDWEKMEMEIAARREEVVHLTEEIQRPSLWDQIQNLYNLGGT